MLRGKILIMLQIVVNRLWVKPRSFLMIKMQMIQKYMKQQIAEWSEELAEKLGRSSQEIESQGLKAGDY